MLGRVPDARELSMLRRCAASGASARTIEVISQLQPATLRRYIFGNGVAVQRGRTAFRDPMAFQADSTRAKVEFSVFFAQYDHGRQGFGPLECLVHAYERNAKLFAQPVVRFDHCFVAVSHLEGLWIADRPTLRLATCRECAALILSSRVDTRVPTCPMCSWREEMRRDPRAALKIPTRPLASNEASLPAHRQAQFDLLLEDLRQCTDDRRVQAQLLAASPYADLMDDVWRKRTTTTTARAIRIERLAENVSTIDLMQYSLALSAYQRLVHEAVPPYQAVLKAYLFIRNEFRFLKTLPLQRVFDFIRQLDGATWGVETRLRLMPCSHCQREFLSSLVDKTDPVCPFCRLSRRPDLYLKQRWVGPKHNEMDHATRQLDSWRATFLG